MEFLINIIYKVLTCCLLSNVLLSCGSLDAYQKSICNRFSGEVPGIETKLCLDGFYVHYYPQNAYGKKYADVVIFYSDGGYITFRIEGDTDENIKSNLMNYAKGYGYSEKKQQWTDSFGVYELQNDTIHSSFLSPNNFVFLPSSMSLYWWMRRDNYYILNKKQVVRYAYADMIRISAEKIVDCDEVFTFIPFKELPSSDMRMKTKRFLWSNEDEWKKYKASKRKNNSN